MNKLMCDRRWDLNANLVGLINGIQRYLYKRRTNKFLDEKGIILENDPKVMEDYYTHLLNLLQEFPWVTYEDVVMAVEAKIRSSVPHGMDDLSMWKCSLVSFNKESKISVFWAEFDSGLGYGCTTKWPVVFSKEDLSRLFIILANKSIWEYEFLRLKYRRRYLGD